MTHHRDEFTLLVGDNPFHGVSHLSQSRSRVRGGNIGDAGYAAKIVTTCLDNGADGFMFSVSGTTLSILEKIHERGTHGCMKLYAIVPYAYEYVRTATQLGGVSGLARKVAKEIAFSGNVKSVLTGLKGLIWSDLAALIDTYVSYEVSRISSAVSKEAKLESILLHEIVTDLSLALRAKSVFRSFIKSASRKCVSPGFETRNFPFLVNRFAEWGIKIDGVTIGTPINKMGFQMTPSREDCEETLRRIAAPSVLGMGIFAGGYLKPHEAVDYIRDLPNLKGVVAGVSKAYHATETFRFLNERLRPAVLSKESFRHEIDVHS